MYPSISVQTSRNIPTIQLISRGLRYAPVKKTRIWWRMTAAIMSVAAHLCTPRRYQP